MSFPVSRQESAERVPSTSFDKAEFHGSSKVDNIAMPLLQFHPIGTNCGVTSSPTTTTDLKSPITTAIVIPILRKEGSLKLPKKAIVFEQDPIKETRFFEREDEESWHLFSQHCCHFPGITSEEKARELLTKYSVDPNVSPFIPEDSELSAGKKLDAAYEKIKFSGQSDILVWFYSLYFTKAVSDSPELYDEMDIFLQNHPDESRKNVDVFWAAHKTALKKNTLETLLNLIPLEEMAKLRLDADLVSIVNSSCPKEEIKWHVSDYQQYENLMNSLSNYQFKGLNLSSARIEVFPPRLLPCLQSVRKLNLGTNYDNIPDAIFRDQLPNLTYLTLSYTAFDEQFSSNFLQTIKLLKNLKEIDLSRGQVDPEEIPDIVNYAIEKKIDLIFPIPKKERDLILLMEHLGLSLLERSENAKLRVLSRSAKNPQDGLKMNNQGHYKALVNHIKSPDNLKTLQDLTTLNLSGLSIETLPEEICELTEITSVVLSGAQSQPIEMILKLPNLKWIEFLDHAFEEAFRPFIDECKERNIAILPPLNEQESNLLSFLEKNPDFNEPEEYSSADDLLNQILCQKEVLENIGVLDFSEMNIDILPLSLIRRFLNVRTLILRDVYPERSNRSLAFNSLLQLPKLEKVDLSGNFISPPIFATLSYLLKNPNSKINTITLFGCGFYEKDFDAFTRLCASENVTLLSD